ncbi:MAG: alpha/beta hydrolase [Cohaesibacter sp.]|nr:alpha/beta hydrolase [Cohaesibacter sp.]
MANVTKQDAKVSGLFQMAKALLACFFIIQWLCAVLMPTSHALADDSHTPLQPLDCPGQRPKGEAVVCFILHLPADWSDLSGRSIELPVMRFAPTGDLQQAAKANKAPLLVILGGPGQSAIYARHALLKRLAPLRKDRELILMDQRGTGPFNPDLSCQAAIEKGSKISAEKIIDCANSAKAAGIRLSDYTTEATARDYQALRYALKIEKWSIIATSYGARVAQKLLDLDEKGMDRLIFNSPHFLHHLLLDWQPFSLVERLMDQCNEEESCREHYPNLYWDFQSLQFDMAKVSLSDEALALITKGQQDQPSLTKEEQEEQEEQIKVLVYQLYRQHLQKLLARNRAGEVPHDIWQITLSLQKALKEQTPWSPPKPLATNAKNISQLLHFTIFCQEEGARMKAKGWDRIEQQLYAQFYQVICEKLDLPDLPKGWDKAKSSKKPILILTGALDTIVDSSSTKAALKLYPKAKWLNSPHAGHDASAQDQCAYKAQQNFLNGQTIDTSCFDKRPMIFLQRGPTIVTSDD